MENNELFDFEFYERWGHWSVTAYNGSSEEVILPASHEGKPVKKIGYEFSLHNKGIKHVIIPEGYASIEDGAFCKCTGLTEIILPESLTSIGEYAFAGCTGLTKIELPENLASIDKEAFASCKRLTEISLPENLNSIGRSAFEGCTGLTKIKLPESLTSIEEAVFFDCAGLTKIKLPENLTFIDCCAFNGCTGLTEVNLPESLVSIGRHAFYDCTGLKEIKLPESLETIGDHAFANCTGIKTITLPMRLRYIGECAFENCPNLDAIALSGKAKMAKPKQLPKNISAEDIDIVKISLKNDDEKLNGVLCVFKENLEHLSFWTSPSDELLFNTIDDMKNYYIKSKLTCYAVLHKNEIIGCIDVSKKETDEKKLSFCKLNYWIDKNHVRKGIMFKCLKSLETVFEDHGLDYLCARVEEINIPSVNLLRKLGYIKHTSIGFIVDEEEGKEWNVYEYRRYL